MMRFISISLICLLVSACANTQTVNLDAGSNNRFSGKSVIVTKRAFPLFFALTPKNAIFSSAIVLSPHDLGRKVVDDNNIDNPADYIADVLSKDFASTFNVVLVKNENEILKSGKVKKIIEQYPNTDYVMDVQTFHWGFNYFPTTFGKYQIFYWSKLRLIDIKQGLVIAQGTCKRNPKKTPNAPSYAEMLSDEAFIIKRELNISANECINEFKRDVLNLPETPLETIQLVTKEAPTSTQASNSDGSATLDKTVVESQYPETLNQLQSASSVEMRLAAIDIGKEKLYSDEAIFLALVNLLENEVAQDDKPIEKIRTDGLAWAVISLGRSGDKRAIPVLTKVRDSILPRKVKSHAIAALKRFK